MRILSLLFLMLLVGCGEETAESPSEKKKPELVLTEARFEDLPGWGSDNFETFVLAYKKSCDRIAKREGDLPFGELKEAGRYADWQRVCEAFDQTDVSDLRIFFEEHFTPYQVSAGENSVGLFTGYYESSLRGSRVETDRFNIPLHARPDDLVMVQLGEFREDLKGVRIAGRVIDGNLKPYEERAEIVAGDWPHNDKILMWVDDAIDAFFVQIQGSGLVKLEDGSTMRIGYAGQNGHPYYAIGRELIKMGALTKENVSLQTIRAWLAENPDQADAVMNTNKSYVFFREITGEGPIGGEGVALTAGRSLAVDRTLLSYGLPLWVDISPPVEEAKPIQRMMIAQDTGGAIIGPVRGDVFWGYGEIAEEMAGRMKSEGRYWVLLPKKDQ